MNILYFDSVSGAVFNPAVGNGLIMSAAAWYSIAKHGGGGLSLSRLFAPLWIYYVAPLLAAVVGALLFRLTNRNEYHHKKR